MSLNADQLFNVRGKVALVTGGATGIGRMIAQGLLDNGARVYIASRKLDVCEAAAKEMSPQGNCIALRADVSTVPAIDALAAEIAAREPKLHILVNNSGGGWTQPIEEYSEDGWDKMMTLNVKAPFYLFRALLPQLKAAGEPMDPARVINIGSVGGIETQNTDNYVYGPSKAAVHHLTRQLAARFARQHITVNVIAPGPLPSVMMSRGGGRLDHFASQTPLGRAGTTEEMAGTALYLCGRAGAYTTGVVIPVDGGKCVAGANAFDVSE
jgi:NAD(P)-dependent dehydrogenase (short-subunit alcohol dehydrogenase family)